MIFHAFKKASLFQHEQQALIQGLVPTVTQPDTRDRALWHLKF